MEVSSNYQTVSKGNLTLAAAVLFSAITFKRIAKYFDLQVFNGSQKLAHAPFKKGF